MSRQAWLDTSSLLEAISEYIGRCTYDTSNGFASGDSNALTNLLAQLQIPTAGYMSDPKVPLQNMSNNFIEFMSTTDRCGFMLKKEWFSSDIQPVVSDDFIATYIKSRNQVPYADVLRQINYPALQASPDPKLIVRQSAVMRGSDTPYTTPIEPCDAYRSVAGGTGNVARMGLLATPPVQNDTFFVAERGRILFGIRAAAAVQGNQQIPIPPWASILQVTNARLYFTDSFFGTSIAGVTATTVPGEAATNVVFPGDANDMVINSDDVVSLSLNGGNISVTLGVPRVGFCIAIDGIFTMLANRSQNYYTLTTAIAQNAHLDDFGLSAFLVPTMTALTNVGQAGIFSDAINALTTALIANYTTADVAAAIAFNSPWNRFSERMAVIMAAGGIADINVKRLIIRHLWIITSLIAVFGRYYHPN
nr:outer capsid protein [Homalodisca vitripennis reovirus]